MRYKCTSWGDYMLRVVTTSHLQPIYLLTYLLTWGTTVYDSEWVETKGHGPFIGCVSSSSPPRMTYWLITDVRDDGGYTVSLDPSKTQCLVLDGLLKVDLSGEGCRRKGKSEIRTKQGISCPLLTYDRDWVFIEPFDIFNIFQIIIIMCPMKFRRDVSSYVDRGSQRNT